MEKLERLVSLIEIRFGPQRSAMSGLLGLAALLQADNQEYC